MEAEIATNPADTQQGVDPAHDTAAEHQLIDDLDLGETEHGQETDPVDESEEVDYEGKKYRLPKELKDALLRQSDYTRKTQEVAEQRRALEEQQQRFHQQAQQHQEHIKEVARLVSMDEQLEQYRKIDWDALWQQDPAQHSRLSQQFNVLRDARERLVGELHQKDQQRAIETQRETARRLEEAHAVLKREIPEWSPEHASKLRDFAISKGVPAQEVAQITSPTVVKLLHLAFLGEQLLTKQRAAAKPQQTPANPVPQVSARAARAAKDPDRMTTDEWMKWQDELEAKKRRSR